MSGSQQVYTLADLRNWSEVTAGLEFPARLAVIGDPVAHSRSPQMHNPALRSAGLDCSYVRLHLAESDLAEAVELMREAGFIGFNATIPHKGSVCGLVDDMSETARRIGAVNTVAFCGDRITGHNTDAPGMQAAVREAFSRELGDLRILILGAGGGAGRAAAVQCAMEGCQRLVLVNRTEEKAQALAGELSEVVGSSDRLRVVPWEAASLRGELDEIDLILNASSIGMQAGDPEVVPRELLQPQHLVYDMVYAPARTRLLIDAEAAGAIAANGLWMLLWQGALAFEYWFDREAPVEVMRDGLKS